MCSDRLGWVHAPQQAVRAVVQFEVGNVALYVHGEGRQDVRHDHLPYQALRACNGATVRFAWRMCDPSALATLHQELDHS